MTQSIGRADRAPNTGLANPGASASTQDVIDVAESLRRMGNSRELFAEVVMIYKEDSPSLLERIRTAVGEGNASALHRAAHGLKGLASNFGAIAATEAAYALERMGALGNLDGSVEAMQTLEQEVDRLNRALEPFARQSPNEPSASRGPAR